MATAMLSNGADLRCLQEILGHEKLETTKVHTQLSIERLKEVHAATHPAVKLTRVAGGGGADESTGDGTTDRLAAGGSLVGQQTAARPRTESGVAGDEGGHQRGREGDDPRTR